MRCFKKVFRINQTESIIIGLTKVPSEPCEASCSDGRGKIAMQSLCKVVSPL